MSLGQSATRKTALFRLRENTSKLFLQIFNGYQQVAGKLVSVILDEAVFLLGYTPHEGNPFLSRTPQDLLIRCFVQHVMPEFMGDTVPETVDVVVVHILLLIHD